MSRLKNPRLAIGLIALATLVVFGTLAYVVRPESPSKPPTTQSKAVVVTVCVKVTPTPDKQASPTATTPAGVPTATPFAYYMAATATPLTAGVPTIVPTPIDTPMPGITEPPVPTSIPVTDTPTDTAVPTATDTPTDTSVPTATDTPADTAEPTATATDTPEPTATATNTPIPPTDTPIPAPTATKKPKPTATATDVPVSPTDTPTPAPTATKKPKPTDTATATATPEPHSIEIAPALQNVRCSTQTGAFTVTNVTGAAVNVIMNSFLCPDEACDLAHFLIWPQGQSQKQKEKQNVTIDPHATATFIVKATQSGYIGAYVKVVGAKDESELFIQVVCIG